MALISINGVALPAPTKYGVDLQDIDSENTQRTETGVLSRDRVRAGVYKIRVTWLVDDLGLKKITTAMSSDMFSVTFFDPNTGGYPTADMYCGDRSGDMRHFKSDSPGQSLWEISTNLVEF